MNVQRAIDFLRTGQFYFVEPTVWNDPYEKRFYTADYKNINYQPRQLFCTCLTSEISNEAAWRMYRGNNGGITDRTIRIDFNRSILFKVLSEYSANFYLGCVDYTFTTAQINKLHTKNSSKYSELFDDFSDEKFMNLLLIKRRAFQYESEVRLFMLPKDRTPIEVYPQSNVYGIAPVYFDKTDLIQMVEKISVDPSCSEIEYEMIKSLINKILPNKPCRLNNLYAKKPLITIE